jgi:hypothetical protein
MAVAFGIISVTFLTGAFQLWTYPFPRGALIIGAVYAGFASAGWTVLWNIEEGSGRTLSNAGRRGARLWTLVFSTLIGSPVGALSLCMFPLNVQCTLTADAASPEQLTQLQGSVAKAALFIVTWLWW